MSERLKDALEARREADLQVENALRIDYPVGARIKWAFHGRVRHGVVTRKLYGDRIEVENAETGKRLQIYAYRIIEAMK